MTTNLNLSVLEFFFFRFDLIFFSFLVASVGFYFKFFFRYFCYYYSLTFDLKKKSNFFFQTRRKFGSFHQEESLFRSVVNSILKYPTPSNLNYWWNFGSL